jgi:hypothetical protein
MAKKKDLHQDFKRSKEVVCMWAILEEAS